jgi:hypothetical protein
MENENWVRDVTCIEEGSNVLPLQENLWTAILWLLFAAFRLIRFALETAQFFSARLT